jgi:ubiquinone/menaquinone biosynthesis C-methylase UbiE
MTAPTTIAPVLAAARSSIDDVNQRSWSSSLWSYSYRQAEALFPAEIAILAELHAELAQARLIDLGVGTGRTTLNLASKVKSYVGLDYSPTMIERARERCPDQDLRVADARDLSAFADASADAVLFSFNGIDYVDHRGRMAVFAEILRVLRPGGIFIFSSHNRDTLVPKAYSLANLLKPIGPLKIARNAASYTHGIINSVLLSHRQSEATEYALRNDAANHYSLLTYYIRAEDQVAQLTRSGFATITVRGLDGQRLDPGQTCKDYMLHYVCRRP